MKSKNFALVLVLALLLSSCGSFAPEPTPTSTPLPPTATATSTQTAIPVPTNTPDRTATVAAKATQAAEGILADLDDELGDEEIDYSGGRLLWQQETPLSIEMTGPASQYQPFAEGLVASDFILKSDVTWKASGIIICGVIFRSEEDLAEGDQYQFLYLRFSGAPAWAIEYHEFGYFKNSPTKVQYSDAVDLANKATNQLIIVARGEEFTVFINGQRQGRYFDYSKQRLEGGFATLAMQDSGEGSCEFENTYVWALK
jgi:hypothetical protein